MKKRLLLIALPVFMALTGCKPSPIRDKEYKYLQEDTLAHEEIFGEAVEASELGARIARPYKLATLTSDFVKIGYQIKFDDKGNADASDDVISIRFVAAIKDAGVTAYWHRCLSKQDST